ncbi:MAG: hypothetical protein JRI92_10750, partial [Deltaproteobacteria bacterium]|nr:hypothetical protein [Deltaproteobacteria bacterium]
MGVLKLAHGKGNIMPNDNSFFDALADSIIRTVTYFVNSYSGMLQVFIYLLMVITFSFALIKSYQAFRALAFHRPNDIKKRIGSNDFHGSIKTPLSVIAAGLFNKTKKHYDDEKERG